jgi:hypothetical protein
MALPLRLPGHRYRDAEFSGRICKALIQRHERRLKPASDRQMKSVRCPQR